MVQQLAAVAAVAEKSDAECEMCSAPAVFVYRWEWGEQGRVCAEHATLLQQKQPSLNRTITMHPIVQPGPAPLLRDERTRLTAAALVLEEELEESKTKGLELYRHNGDLQVQLNTAVVRERELKAQVEDLRTQLATAGARADAVERENGTLLAELQRLRQLETFVAERDARERQEMGLQGGEPPTTVDG